MKYIKYILLFIFTYIFFNLNVFANACSYKEQVLLNNDLSNIKISYEIVNNNIVNILIYNITENVYVSFVDQDTNLEKNIYYTDTNNGKYIIQRDTSNLEQYKFQIRSHISTCYGNILSTKVIIKPKYNIYHKLEICKSEELQNHSLCQEFTTVEITKTENEVIKILEEFLNNKVKVITTENKEAKTIDIKTVITFSALGVVVIGIIVTIVVIIKKRGEL